MNTLQEIENMRADTADERFERARRLSESMLEAAQMVRRNLPYNRLPTHVREHLENCSDTCFRTFADIVQGRRRSSTTSQRKVL
ncbi:MAG TPA: hypothetical protein VMV10_02190 [Pirellulales bacterium]|nr:hypothetical protein [Pirellulales bacterium]